jgi:hypothetical protein
MTEKSYLSLGFKLIGVYALVELLSTLHLMMINWSMAGLQFWLGTMVRILVGSLLIVFSEKLARAFCREDAGSQSSVAFDHRAALRVGYRLLGILLITFSVAELVGTGGYFLYGMARTPTPGELIDVAWLGTAPPAVKGLGGAFLLWRSRFL